jgi:hypothetical protein
MEVLGRVVDLDNLNQLIWSMGLKFRAVLAQRSRTLDESPLYNHAVTLATTQLFLCLPEAVRRTLKRITPEELAQRGKYVGSPVSPLSIWLFGYCFLIGREVLIDFEQISAKEHAEDIALVLDFWRRLAFAYRDDGRLDNSDAGATNEVLPPATVQALYDALLPVDAAIQPRLHQFLSTMDAYHLWVHAGAHVGKADSGPYPLNVDRVLIVRDCCDLKGTYYPWHDSVAQVLPYQTCTLAMTFDAADFQTLELSDESELQSVPAAYQSYIREIAFLAGKDGPGRVLPVTEMDWLTRSMKKVFPKLEAWFARQKRHEQILAQALPQIVAPLALLSAAEAYRGREYAPQALQLLAAYEDNDTAAARWRTRRCLAPGSMCAFVPVM